MRLFIPERPSAGLRPVACLLATAMLGGCGATHAIFGTDTPTVVRSEVPVPVAVSGTPVPPALSRALDIAPAGGTLEYRLANGGQVEFVLGPLYQSGLAVPCRVGTVNALGTAAGAPTAYAFCRQGAMWQEMPPVVVSGY